MFLKKFFSRVTIALLSATIVVLIAPIYSAAQEKTPELFETSFGHESQGNYAAALNNVLKILRAEKDNYIATLRAGWLNYLSGNFNEAVEYYRKAVNLSPKAIEPKLGLMLPLMSLQRWKEAENTANEILKATPGNYLALSRLAYIQYSQGDYAKALVNYQKALELFPSELEMMLGLGWTYLKMGKNKEAAKWFEATLAVRPNNVSALQGLQIISK